MAFSRSTARRARSLALSPAIRLKRNVGASPHASRARASPDASGAVRAIRAFETWVRCERLRRLCNEGRRKVGVIDPLLRCGLAFDQWRPRLDPQPALVYQCRFPDGRGRPPDLLWRPAPLRAVRHPEREHPAEARAHGGESRPADLRLSPGSDLGLAEHRLANRVG